MFERTIVEAMSRFLRSVPVKVESSVRRRRAVNIWSVRAPEHGQALPVGRDPQHSDET